MGKARRTEPEPDPIGGVILRSRASMVLEEVARGFWPLASLIALVWSALAFGVAEMLPRTLVAGGLAVTALASLGLALRGFRRFRWPTREAALARIDANLPGRPLAALDDRPALGRDDPGAEAVWAVHLARMRRLARSARPALPDLALARFDPWALRLMALVLLFAALVFARGSTIDGVSAALAPSPAPAVADGPAFEAWAEPPAYTGLPTLYLPEVIGDQPVSVPQGTAITVRVYGQVDRFSLKQSVAPGAEAALTEAATGIASASFVVAEAGSVELAEGDRSLGAWTFAMLPDLPPEIDLAEPVRRAATGELQLGYVASDDYGVIAARAEITLDLSAVDRRHGLAAEPVARPALTLDLPLPLAGDRTEIAETLVEDLSKHPWAGLPVTIRLEADDAAGQTGERDDLAAVLAGRRFFDPLAAALVEQRRDLLWTPKNAARTEQVLRAVTHRPEAIFDSERAYLLTRIAIRRLGAAASAGDPALAVDEVAEMLWQAAMLLEEGSLGDAAERLERARERLSEALRGDATDEEIAQLMDELREATRDYMEQLAQEAIERGQTETAEAPPPGQSMSQDQIQELMDRIQELSEQGRRAEAEALLEMLRQMLENMEMRLTEGGEGQGQGNPGDQALQGLSDALREQQGLADDSFRELQRQFREGHSGQQPGQGEQGGAGEGDQRAEPGQEPGGPEGLAERQEALRELMEQLQRGLPGDAGEAARQALREAERNMGAARDGLRDGDTAGALDRQADAIDSLREGMSEMADAMREAQEGPTGEQATREGDGSSDGRNDPLGRPLGANGSIGTNESMLPEADAAARARGIFDEIRRRSGEQMRPQLELDYLRRLLERF